MTNTPAEPVTVPVEHLRRLAAEWRTMADTFSSYGSAGATSAADTARICAADLDGLVLAAEAGALTDGTRS